MEIRPLGENDDRSGFKSDDPDLDRYLAKYASQNQFRHHIGTTYVAVESERILGYATVAAGQVDAEGLSVVLRRRLPRYPLPVLRLARLAVDARDRDRGVGRALLRHVFRVALAMAGQVGCVGVVVDAKPGAVDYYERFGFEPLEVVEGCLEARPAPVPVFLPLGKLVKSLPGR